MLIGGCQYSTASKSPERTEIMSKLERSEYSPDLLKTEITERDFQQFGKQGIYCSAVRE